MKGVTFPRHLTRESPGIDFPSLGLLPDAAAMEVGRQEKPAVFLSSVGKDLCLEN